MPTNSVQSRIVDAVVAALSGPAIQAWRCRLTPFTARLLPAINVVPLSWETEGDTTDTVERHFKFDLRFVIQATDEADAAVDPFFVAGSGALLKDPTLGGLCTFLYERSAKWDTDGDGELDTVALVVTYECLFSTSRVDPSESYG